MTTQPDQELNRIDVTDREHWIDGPPHRIFGELRRECPVHWSEILGGWMRGMRSLPVALG